MSEVDNLIKMAADFCSTQRSLYYPYTSLTIIESLLEVIREQQQQLQRVKELTFTNQTDYLIVGTLRQELSPSQTGDNVV
jgi:hypothetical protein